MNRIWTLALAAGLAACSSPSPSPVATQEPAKPAEPPAQTEAAPAPAPASGPMAGPVLETMDTGGYTYVKVKTPQGEVWAAAPQVRVEVGQEVVVQNPMPMPGYHSKTLDRTFEMLYFSSAIVPAGQDMAAAEAPQTGAASRAKMAADVDLTGIRKAEGGHTVEELFAQKTDLAGQQVVVRGKVVKFNAGIMGRNWIHLRDGTGAEGANDLTVTTQARASVGDTVLVRGTVATDKDFGFGYRYALMLEDAEVTKE
ncbi:hypothetical protein [Deferrisoma sp.]